MSKLITLFHRLRGLMKQSRFKIWLRAGLLIQFSLMFSYLLYLDIQEGYFTWGWSAVVVILSVPLGFWISRWVPMRYDEQIQKVTLSIDIIYLVLIWILVIIRVSVGIIGKGVAFSDVIMCVIIGMMAGRLGGIGLRVRKLKREYGLV